MRSRATGSSSTTIVRILLTPLLSRPRPRLRRLLAASLHQRDRNAARANRRRRLPELEPMRATRTGAAAATAYSPSPTPRLKSVNRAADSPTPLSRTSSSSRRADAPAPNLDLAGRRPRTNAVLDGVFDERLEHKVGHQRVERVRLHVEHNGQTIPEARLFDLQVLREEIELLLQRHFLHADVLQRHAQQVAQLRDHVVGGIDVAVHQRRDRVERVEQEVRLQLPLQRLELRFDQMRFELAFAQRAIARFAVIPQRVAETDDGPVGHHLPVEIVEEHVLRFGSQGERWPTTQTMTICERHRQHDVRGRRDEDAGHVHGNRRASTSRARTAPGARATGSPASDTPTNTSSQG